MVTIPSRAAFPDAHPAGVAVAVAAGHPETVRAAHDALAAGGNAFDAVVAAGFTAAVAEPTLSGLAGGGFLLAAPVGEQPRIIDFFVDVPGRGRPPAPVTTDPVVVRFHGAEQVFHVGAGSIAVPGCLSGYLAVHARYGRLPLERLVAPAARLARRGVTLGAAQAAVVRLLAPILAREPEGAARFGDRDGTPFADDRVVVNLPLATFLDDVAAGRRTSFADPDLGDAIVRGLAAQGGAIGPDDLTAHEVIERVPLTVGLDGRTGQARLHTNPGPSFGGTVIADALGVLAELPTGVRGQHGDGTRLVALTEALERATRRMRTAPAAAGIAQVRRQRGTTHVSVRDAEGNLAAMTTSNGSNSGVHLAGTGVMANNIMGEEDLRPAGGAVPTPGTRVGSMMAPTILERPGRPTVVLGSGGSERIRSALTQVIAALVFDDLPLAQAVLAPRIHVDGDGVVQVEPGIDPDALDVLRGVREVNVWSATDLYFGGVHAVDTDGAHVGDPRRGGVSAGPSGTVIDRAAPGGHVVEGPAGP
jgi:gamma-glutamyltranspeptidase/glutathione hydrolase